MREVTAKKIENKPGFLIHTSGKRTYNIIADDDAKQQSWVKAIQDILVSSAQRQDDCSVCKE